MQRVVRYAVYAAVTLALTGMAFVGGMFFERLDPLSFTVPVIENSPTDLTGSLSEVRNVIDAEALRPSSEESMTAGAIQGLLNALDDPYAIYFDAMHYQYFSEQTDGEFYGIGITITAKDGVPTVVTIIENTPAEAAGLKPDDVIVGIDGIKRAKWDLEEVVTRVRGPEGTAVKLDVARKGQSKPLTFTIKRAKIDVPNITTRMEGKDIGYIRLFSFNAKAADDLRAAIRELSDKGAKGFVLDLRDNPGGLLPESVDVASLFVSDGVIVRVEERDKPEEEYRAKGKIATDKPLVVLVNENSASASEIVAGALQDYARAVLVGQTSFGKGSVQTVRRLRNGAAMKFTIAHYLTPKKREIDGKGIVPDVVVKMDPADEADEKTDVQLKKAIEVLRAKL